MDSPKKLRLYTFSMIEIMVAMFVVLIALISAVSLVPLGQQTTKEAVSQADASIAAEQFLNYYSSKVKARWALINALPINKPEDDESGVNWQLSDSGDIITVVDSLRIYYDDQDNDKRFDYKDQNSSTHRDDSGLFKLEQLSATNVTDFSAVCRVWTSPAYYNTTEDDGTGTIVSVSKALPPDSAVVLNVEVSYPAGAPYAERQKSVYSMNIFQPAEEPLEDQSGAFVIQDDGSISVIYHGSEAGYTNALNLYLNEEYGNVTNVFPNQKKQPQNTPLSFPWKPGDSFNFYITTTPSDNASKNKYGEYEHHSWAPEPPGCECDCLDISGDLNINPNNSPQSEFELVAADGTTITRDDLHKNASTYGKGTYWEGTATYIRVKPKGNGNQNGLILGDQAYDFDNGKTYTITGDSDVRIYNDKMVNGKAMGHWWLSSVGDCVQLLEEGEAHTIDCPKHPSYAGPSKLPENAPPYFDNPAGSNYDGAYCSQTGNPFVIVTEELPGRRWKLGFEDLPNGHKWTDWDYDDVVISVELSASNGVSESISGVSSDGTITLNPNDGKWRFTATLIDGTMFTGHDLDEFSNQKLKAATVWMRPTGSGSQTIDVDGAPFTMDNSQMLSVCSSNVATNWVDLEIYKSGGKWKAKIGSTSAFVTLLD